MQQPKDFVYPQYLQYVCKLQEEICMQQPKGYVYPHYLQYVYKLNKTLYGLKQASESLLWEDLSIFDEHWLCYHSCG